MLGLVFTAAGMLKLLKIHEFRATIDTILAQTVDSRAINVGLLRDSMAAATPGVELAIGLALIVFARRPRIPAATAAGALILLSLVLGLLLTLDRPPSCGCFGSWELMTLDARSAAKFGLVRNVGLLMVAIWVALGTKNSDIEHTPQATNDRSAQVRSGFTLVELLVVLVVVSLLIAILLPALGQAKRAGRSVDRLSATRQAGTAISSYVSDSAGFLPYLATPGQPDLGIFHESDWGDLPPPSYFRGQSALWPTALLRQGIDISHLPDTSRPETGPERIHTYFWMTHAAVARPAYWLHGDPPDDPSLFAGVRLDEALFPSSKGLLGFVGWSSSEAGHMQGWEVGMCDGSAKLRSTQNPPLRVDGPYRPFGAADWRVLTTYEGIRGRDY